MYFSILVIYLVHLVSAQNQRDWLLPDHCFEEATRILCSRFYPGTPVDTCPDWPEWMGLYYLGTRDEICLLPLPGLCVSADFCIIDADPGETTEAVEVMNGSARFPSSTIEGSA